MYRGESMRGISISEIYAFVSFLGAVIAIVAATIAPWLAERARFKGNLKLRQSELLFSEMASAYQELFVACDTWLQSDTPENRNRASVCVSRATLFARKQTQQAMKHYITLVHTYVELSHSKIPPDNIQNSMDKARADMIASMQHDLRSAVHAKQK